MGEAIATNDINLGSGNDTVELSTIVNAYDNYQDKLSETIVVPGDGNDEVNVDAVCYSEYDVRTTVRVDAGAGQDRVNIEADATAVLDTAELRSVVIGGGGRDNLIVVATA